MNKLILIASLLLSSNVYASQSMVINCHSKNYEDDIFIIRSDGSYIIDQFGESYPKINETEIRTFYMDKDQIIMTKKLNIQTDAWIDTIKIFHKEQETILQKYTTNTRFDIKSTVIEEKCKVIQDFNYSK